MLAHGRRHFLGCINGDYLHFRYHRYSIAELIRFLNVVVCEEDYDACFPKIFQKLAEGALEVESPAVGMVLKLSAEGRYKDQ